MGWVEFEKIKLESEKGRALLTAEYAIKQMQFIVEKVVDVDLINLVTLWNGKTIHISITRLMIKRNEWRSTRKPLDFLA